MVKISIYRWRGNATNFFRFRFSFDCVAVFYSEKLLLIRCRKLDLQLICTYTDPLPSLHQRKLKILCSRDFLAEKVSRFFELLCFKTELILRAESVLFHLLQYILQY